MRKSITTRELAAQLPKKDGRRGVHPVTVNRMIDRGDLPKPDFKFKNGTAGWFGKSLDHPQIAPFVDDSSPTKAA